MIGWILDRLGYEFVDRVGPKEPRVCPNPECHRDLMPWTESTWQDGEFFTMYWWGCPVYYNLRSSDRGFSEYNKHYAKWKRTSWGVWPVLQRKAAQ